MPAFVAIRMSTLCCASPPEHSAAKYGHWHEQPTLSGDQRPADERSVNGFDRLLDLLLRPGSHPQRNRRLREAAVNPRDTTRNQTSSRPQPFSSRRSSPRLITKSTYYQSV